MFDVGEQETRPPHYIALTALILSGSSLSAPPSLLSHDIDTHSANVIKMQYDIFTSLVTFELYDSVISRHTNY